MEAEPWYLPVGERLDDRRAEAIVARFAAEARAVGESVIARLQADRPDREVQGRVYGVRTVLMAFQVARGPNDGGIWIGDVRHSHAGTTVVVGLVLRWESGAVVVVGGPE